MDSPANPDEGAPAPARTWILVALCAITLLALALRLSHRRYLLPHHPESDASAILQTELLLGYDLDRSDPQLGKYPLLVPYLAALGGPWPEHDRVERPLDEHLLRAAIPAARLRLVVSLLSVLMVVGTWLVARNFMGHPAALLASWVVATSLLGLTYSTQARPHAAAAPFVLLTVAAAIRLARTGRLRDYFLTAVAAALVLGALQNGLAALIPCALAGLVHGRRRPWKTLAGCMLGLTTIGLSLFVTYPFLFAESRGVDPAQLEIVNGRLMQSGHTLGFHLFRGGGFEVTARALFGYDPWQLMALLGLAAWLVKRYRKEPRTRDWSLAVVLSYCVPYALVIGLYDPSHPRFSLPLMPFTVMLGAYGIEAGARWFKARAQGGTWQPALATALLVLVFAVPPLASSLRLLWLRSRADTETQAALWVRENLDRTAVVGVLPPIHLPLPVDASALDPLENTVETTSTFLWLGYLSRVPHAVRPPGHDLRYGLVGDADALLALRDDTLSYLERLKCAWLIVDASQDWKQTVLMRDVHDVIAEHGELVTKFEPLPFAEGELRYAFLYDPVPGGPLWIGQLWRARCLGPVIEVYRWPGSDS